MTEVQANHAAGVSTCRWQVHVFERVVQAAEYATCASVELSARESEIHSVELVQHPDSENGAAFAHAVEHVRGVDSIRSFR